MPGDPTPPEGDYSGTVNINLLSSACGFATGCASINFNFYNSTCNVKFDIGQSLSGYLAYESFLLGLYIQSTHEVGHCMGLVHPEIAQLPYGNPWWRAPTSGHNVFLGDHSRFMHWAAGEQWRPINLDYIKAMFPISDISTSY